MKNNNSQTGKKYKLIKNYPGCRWSLGTTCVDVGYRYNMINRNGCFDYEINKFMIEDFPEFWEEVVDLRYEILSFRLAANGIHPATIWDADNKGLFGITGQLHWCTLELMLKNSGNNTEIYSVKRLSDGEIFTVGDRISSHNMEKNIKAIKVINGLSQELEFTTFFDNIKSTGFQYLFADNVQKVKKPLLVTMDGAYVFEGDKIWRLNGLYEVLEPIEAKSHHAKWSEDWFSTKKVAQNYALMNKPCMSVNDIISQTEDAMSRTQSKLIEIAKSKL